MVSSSCENDSTIEEREGQFVILRAIKQTDGNQNQASEILGISRVTLRAKLRSMGLLIEKTLAPRSGDPTQH